MKTLQDVTKDFFESILDVIAKNSSKSYGLIILKDMKKNFIKDFPVLKFIELDDPLKIDANIKSADVDEISMLFNKIIDTVGPDMLKIFIKEEMDPTNIKYLSNIGVKF